MKVILHKRYSSGKLSGKSNKPTAIDIRIYKYNITFNGSYCDQYTYYIIAETIQETYDVDGYDTGFIIKIQIL